MTKISSFAVLITIISNAESRTGHFAAKLKNLPESCAGATGLKAPRLTVSMRLTDGSSLKNETFPIPDYATVEGFCGNDLTVSWNDSAVQFARLDMTFDRKSGGFLTGFDAIIEVQTSNDTTLRKLIVEMQDRRQFAYSCKSGASNKASLTAFILPFTVVSKHRLISPRIIQ